MRDYTREYIDSITDEADRARALVEHEERERRLAERDRTVMAYSVALDVILPGLGEVYAEADEALISGWDDDVSPHIEILCDLLQKFVSRKSLARIEATLSQAPH